MATSSGINKRSLYPPIEPYKDGWIKVSDIHTIYYEECGNPSGLPVVYLHGGPGSGTNPGDRRYFDPDVYRIILLHQRGAGRSTPPAEIQENSTWELVRDLETLRDHVGVASWVVIGGSWGGALALIYAISYPDKVNALVVFGPVLGTMYERDWLYSNVGTANVFPEAWDELIADIPQDELDSTIISAYHKRLFDPDNKAIAKCCKAWNKWEMNIVSLVPNQDLLEKCDREPLWNRQHALLECHYLWNKYFLPHPDWILENLHKIRHIPTTIIHGRFDMAISVRNSWEIHKRLPDAELVIVPLGGHSTRSDDMESALVAATDKYRTIK